jgi:hypothetical protein
MDDLLQRWGWGCQSGANPDLFCEAADEIKRLRAVLREVNDSPWWQPELRGDDIVADALNEPPAGS